MVMPRGYKHSDITIEKIRSANTKQWEDKTIRQKRVVGISRALKGRPKSVEHKQHLKDNHVGRTGKSHSIEQRKRISKTLKGHPGATNQPALVRHHIYLRENSDKIMLLSAAKHNSVHKRAYDYIYATQGKAGIDDYLRWFDKIFGLDLRS